MQEFLLIYYFYHKIFLLKTMFEKIIQAFAHYECVACKEIAPTKKPICKACEYHIEKIKQSNSCKSCGRQCDLDICFFCKKEMPIYTKAKIYCNYNDVSASIIKSYKYYNNALCKNFITNALLEIYESELKKLKIDFVIPVPMNKWREYFKGYNHTTQIAKKIASKKNLKILPFALKKKFSFKKQAGSGRVQRLLNMKNMFSFDSKHNIEGANILLIDDVITTGATIFECTKVLFKNGAKHVFVLTFAKSIADEEMMKNLQEENLH